ncbi:hypothetical protein [Ammonifex thiophilus]|uniref:CobQ/CobB/MinD/ParA nucleotide binding domain-containing protein n=1 Tax=Ammonifex thiophilus TaxID=444093 RepID=A0A3D8P0Q1_9THEO|nr:hypothetical protein [Ammonifex thiophilus]RDV80494.1 hypothetical protein DXX99_10780 [Ammonifex thiophilus]
MILFITGEERLKGALPAVARAAGCEARWLDGAAGVAGPAVVVYVRGSTRRLDEVASLGAPVVVVAGARDPEGEALVGEALACGVPPECVLVLEDGRVVSLAGEDYGPALRGRGVGPQPVARAARRALEEGLLPVPALWEGNGAVPVSHPGEAVLYEAPQWSPCPQAPTASKGETGLAAWLGAAGKTVLVLGVRGGVGATTVAACLVGVLAHERRAVHLELPQPPFGDAPGRLFYTAPGLEGLHAVPSSAPVETEVLVVDASLSVHRSEVDLVYGKAGCVVLVADPSAASFELVGKYIGAGLRCDVLVVRDLPRADGSPPQLYAGEYGFARVVALPSGADEEAAVNRAQKAGVPPIGEHGTPDLDQAAAELAAAVLGVLESGV